MARYVIDRIYQKHTDINERKKELILKYLVFRIDRQFVQVWIIP